MGGCLSESGVGQEPKSITPGSLGYSLRDSGAGFRAANLRRAPTTAGTCRSRSTKQISETVAGISCSTSAISLILGVGDARSGSNPRSSSETRRGRSARPRATGGGVGGPCACVGGLWAASPAVDAAQGRGRRGTAVPRFCGYAKSGCELPLPEGPSAVIAGPQGGVARGACTGARGAAGGR